MSFLYCKWGVSRAKQRGRVTSLTLLWHLEFMQLFLLQVLICQLKLLFYQPSPASQGYSHVSQRCVHPLWKYLLSLWLVSRGKRITVLAEEYRIIQREIMKISNLPLLIQLLMHLSIMKFACTLILSWILPKKLKSKYFFFYSIICVQCLSVNTKYK